MTLAFGGSMPGMQYRRVRIDAVNEDATETSVSDGSGWRTTLDGSIRQKGTLPPEPNEIWIIERYGISWLLKVQERAGSPTLDPTDLAAITAEVERQLAEAAAHEALVASKEAALAAGIMDGDAVVLIQPTTPGPEHQNALTLWIDTTNDLNRPMRWENGQWVVVVDQIAMEAARRAVLAAQAAEAAEQRATDAEAAAAAAQQAAQDALAASQDAVAAATQMQADLVGVQGMIDGKSTIYPVGSNPTLGPEDVGDMRLLIDGGVEYWDGTAWQIADPRVAQAVNEAAEALGLANTKITTYYKATPPDASDIEPPETDFTVGDLWLRSPDNILHRWDGAAWIEFRDAGLVVIEGQISDLQDDLTGLEGKVDGKSTIYVQETAPVEVSGVEHTGDLWIDTSGGGRVYKAWDGTQWVVVDDPRVAEVLDEVSRKITTYYGTDAPTGTVQYPLVIGDLWLREPDNRTFRYDGANWVDVGDTRIFATEQAVAAIQGDLIEMDGKIDGKAEVWFQPDDPSLGAVPAWDIAQMGDIWIDTSVPGEKTYKVWDSNSWETITDPAALAALERVNTRQVTYFASGTTAPSGPNFPPPEGYVVGDLWIRTEDKMVFRWDGASWVDATFIDSRVAAQATAITDIQDNLSGLEGRVDGKAVVWFQPTAPAGLGAADAGDIWIDSDAAPRTFQAWDGTGWVEITDQTALDALAGLEGKITTYYEVEAPVPPAEGFTTGDLWIRTADNRLHRWNGSDWVDLRDPGLAQVAEAISNLQDDLASLDGKVDGRAVVYYQSTDPKDIPAPWGSNETGDVWIDISVPGQTTYKVWDGADWDTITDPVAVQALSTVQTKITTYYKATMPVLGDIQAPETAFRLGDLWIRTTDNRLHRYDGSTFVEVSDVRLSQQATAITNLQNDLSDLSTQVDGKAVIWFQPNAPAGLTATDAGDIWIDSDANPRTFKSWSGSGWVDVTDQTALDALAGLDGKITTYYAPEKAGPAPDHIPPSEGYTEGDLWMNATRGNAVYRYPGSGTAWTLLALGLETIVTDPNAAINPDVVEKLWTDVVRSRKITTDMLVVGSGDNLVPDPHLLDPDLSDARMAAGTGTPWSRVLVDGVNTFTAQVAGSNILPFLAAAGTDAERSHPVTPGKEYRVRFDYRAVGSGALNPTVYLRVVWVDAEGTATTDALITDLAGGPTVWETYEATWTAPATAVAAHLVFEGGGISTWTHQVRGPEIVGKTDPALLVEGSINVALNIAAGGKIISGDPNGTASEVGDHGYSVYRQVEDGRDLSTYLGHEGDQALLLTGSHEGQDVSSGVDSTGSLTVRTGSFTEDISVAGRPLLGQRHDATSEEGWLDQIPTPVAWGDLKAANPTGPELTSAGGTAMIGYITFWVQAGRRYRFSMVYGLQATAVPSNGGRMGGHIKAEFYPNSGGGVPAPLPTPPVDLSSPTVAEFQNIIAYPHVEYGNITGNWVAPADGRVAMGVTLNALAGTGAKLHRGASEGWRLYVDDIGPFNLPDVAVAAAAPPKQTYTTYWAPSSVRVYQGAGNQSWGSYNGVEQVNKINQGSWESWIVGRWGVAQFTGLAVSGDEEGMSITTALSGATVTKATLRVTSAFASARARIGWQSNWTNTPTLQHSSSVVPEGGRVTTTLPSTFHTWVKASTANRYITLGRNGNYTEDYMFIHGTTGGSSNRLLLGLTYTK